MNYFNIYVAGDAIGAENLNRGITHGIWGIRDASIDKKVHVPGDPRTGRDLMESMRDRRPRLLRHPRAQLAGAARQLARRDVAPEAYSPEYG